MRTINSSHRRSPAVEADKQYSQKTKTRHTFLQLQTLAFQSQTVGSICPMNGKWVSGSSYLVVVEHLEPSIWVG